MMQLPSELLLEILTKLDHRALLRCSVVRLVTSMSWPTRGLISQNKGLSRFESHDR
jgi:hypothetical protein